MPAAPKVKFENSLKARNRGRSLEHTIHERTVHQHVQNTVNAQPAATPHEVLTESDCWASLGPAL